MHELAYILSPSYSGSTLLTFLLATHPSIATIGELKATAMGDIDSYRCSCGAMIRECGFWKRLTGELTDRGVGFDLENFGTHFQADSRPLANRLLHGRVRGRLFEAARDTALCVLPTCRRNRERVLQKNQAVIDAIRDIQGGEVFLDGSKDPVRLKHLVASGLWNVKAICLIRDGRGVANSYMRHYDVPMTVAAKEWRQAHEECDRVVSRLPAASSITVHYETLCRDPDRTLSAVFEFLGLDSRRASRDFHAVEHHILGNAMRLRSSSEIVLDEKWKSTLTAADPQTFDRLAGDLNRRYGYE